MRSVGIHLDEWVARGLLQFHADRPSRFGLETHLALMHRAVEEFRPSVVVVDPVTNLLAVGTDIDVRSMLTRVIDFLKVRHVTALFTSLSGTSPDVEASGTMISSLMDSWILTTAETLNYRRHRRLTVLKSRGMGHSDAIREFQFTDRGLEVLPESAVGVPLR
jgi:circadian clock protein KaiC